MAQAKTEITVKAWEHKMETTIKDWERADDYFNSFLMPNDPVLEAASEKSYKHGLPDIAVTPAQGKFLHLLVRSIGAKRVLEIGTLGGSVFCQNESSVVVLTSLYFLLDILLSGLLGLFRITVK